MKVKKLGTTNFIGSPEALKEKGKKKVKAYKKGVAEFKKKVSKVKQKYL
jgi:hypothetical protein